MRCPKCGCQEDKVIDSRASREGATIRRRRECLGCSHRFTTYEEVEHEGLMVLKRDGRREEFSREKLLSGMRKACQKRPVSPKSLDDLVDHIVAVVTAEYENEVPGEAIGKMVMDGLRELDVVAYVRFASVYRRFEEATDFVQEVEKLEADKMIALQSECLIFQLTNGESIPCSVEMISIEIVGQSDGYGLIDPKMLRHATASVFHYFKTELDRESVTISEFSQALEKALHGLGLTIFPEKPATPPDAIEADLALLAQESADNLELFFFPRLRDTLRTQLSQAPRVLRFYGLRGCVKQLAGARRWSSRCAKMEEQIVEYLRQCLTAEPKTSKCALVVE